MLQKVESNLFIWESVKVNDYEKNINSDKLNEVLSSIEVFKRRPFVNQHDIDKITSELCNVFIVSTGMTFRNRNQASEKINSGLLELAARQEEIPFSRTFEQ